MTKTFKLSQLFSIVDGRLFNKIDDVYDILNHVTDTELMTHHLPIANNYLKLKNPKWLRDIKSDLISLKATKETTFEKCVEIVNKNNKKYEISQLKDVFNTLDFKNYMIENSLLLKKK